MRAYPIEKQIYQRRFSSEIKARDALWHILVSQFFQQYVSKKAVVLDLATGYGEFINNIQAKKKFACDINPDSKKYLSKNVTFLQSSSTNIKLKSNSVDVIFISNFFEHITREEIIKTIRECKRLLVNGGQVLILQPNIRFCQKDYWMFFDHITPIDDRALIEIFSIEGFDVEKNIERFLPYSTKSNLPQYMLLVLLYLKIPILWRIFGKQSFLIFEK